MPLLVQGPQAHQAGVVFPKEQSALDRTLLVGNLNPTVSDEQVCPSLTCFAARLLSEMMVGLHGALLPCHYIRLYSGIDWQEAECGLRCADQTAVWVLWRCHRGGQSG